MAKEGKKRKEVLRRRTAEVAHEGDPQRVVIGAFGVGSKRSPSTALEHRAINPNQETERVGLEPWKMEFIMLHMKTETPAPVCQRASYSLVSDVVEVPLVHVSPLNAQELISAPAQAGALWQSRVVDDDSLSRALQVLPAVRRGCPPLSPRNHVHWKRGNTRSPYSRLPTGGR